MKKRVLTVLMTFVMMVSFMPLVAGDISTVQAATFNPRLSAPAANSPYYSNGAYNPFVTAVGTLSSVPNCTTYAWGRAYEILGTRPPLPTGDAKNWYGAASNKGPTPKLGAIACWNSGNFGHVAVVEEINGNSITLSESSYSPSIYWQLSDKKATNMGAGFQGFIYIGDFNNPSQISVDAGYYKIQYGNSNRFLNVVCDYKDNGTNIDIWSSVTHGGQTFYIDWNNARTGQYISHKTSGKFVDTAGNGTGRCNVQLWEGTGAEGQQWIFEDAGNGYVYIRNLWGRYLDVSGGENAEGTNVQTWEFNGNPSQKWKLVRVSGKDAKNIVAGYYKIRYGKNSRFLNVVGNSTNNGTNIDIWSSVTHGGQTFYIDWNNARTGQYISHKTSGKFVDTAGNGTGRCNVQLWEGTGAEGQQWIFEDAGNGYVYIRNLWGRYLDVSGGENAEGTNVQTWEFNGNPSQKWELVQVSGKDNCTVKSGKYMIQSKTGTKLLDVTGGNEANGANVQLYQSTGADSQVFNVGWNSAIGGYYIANIKSGKFVDSAGNEAAPANVIQWEGTGANGQNWYFEDAGNGYYYIRNLWGYYLDVKDGVDANGTNVRTWGYNGSNAQKWKFVHAHTLIRTPYEAATTSSEGNNEFWTCKECGKYFSDAGGRNEITKAQTTIPKLTSSTPGTNENIKTDLAAVKIYKPKAAKKAMTVKWKKIKKKNLKKIKKVQVQVSRDPNFSSDVVTKNVRAKKTSIKIKKLVSKQKYYVRVRAYTKSGGVVHVSKWSARKTVKIK